MSNETGDIFTDEMAKKIFHNVLNIQRIVNEQRKIKSEDLFNSTICFKFNFFLEDPEINPQDTSKTRFYILPYIEEEDKV